ncbi:MAG: RagB/SusD family nutrient uptake outer membrane protein [Alistipes sp.]|nr:RagB/SusD family nutrient uptake outer membrane protein [Alistipes sp.]
MKKVLLYSAFALGTLTMSTGCGDDFLLLTPVSSTSEGTLNNAEGLDYLLTGAYSTFNSMLSSAGGMGEASLTNWVWGDIVGADANKGSMASDQPDLTELEVWSWSTSNGYIKNRWDAVYESVKRANQIISMATKIDDAALPNKADIIAQAKFIKAFWLFDGIRIYGPAIPYVTVEDYEANTDPQVSNVDENGNYVYIWDKVEQDFLDAIAGLPTTRTSGNYGRATSWMAKAMLAKFYIYWSSPYDGSAGYGTGNKWSAAANLLDEIIASGVDAKGTNYDLADNYLALWDYRTSDWTGESVFDIQFTFHGNTSQTNSPHHTHMTEVSGGMGKAGWGFYQPTYEFVNSYIVDEDGLPLSFAEYTAIDRLTKSQMVDKIGEDGNVELDDEGKPVQIEKVATNLNIFTDPRLDVVAGRFGVPFLDWGYPDDTNLTGWVRESSNAGLYMNKKGHSWKAERETASTTQPTSTSVNYHILRFAEILLMRAECYYQENNFTQVIKIVNQIRERAAKAFVEAGAKTDGDYVMEDMTSGSKIVTENAAANYRIGLYPASYANATQAREALEREYRLEFGMEGHRWFNITRWGKVADVLNAYAASERRYIGKFVNTYDPAWVYMPIPQSEIQTAQGRFVQTPAWL